MSTLSQRIVGQGKRTYKSLVFLLDNYPTCKKSLAAKAECSGLVRSVHFTDGQSIPNESCMLWIKSNMMNRTVESWVFWNMSSSTCKIEDRE